jgi:hypothetical protein
MGPFDRLLRAAAIALAAVGACVPMVSESDRPCPCAEGFMCCETTQTCRKESECPPARTGSDAPYDSTDDLAHRDAMSLPDISSTVLDGGVGADGPPVQVTADSANDLAAQNPSDATARDEENVNDACASDAQLGPQTIASAFLDIGMMTQTERFYSGQFRLSPCTHLANGEASELYTQDAQDGGIPPVTSGLTIVHTFEPAGPYMTPPATQPPDKYSITQMSVAYDPTIDTYTWSFLGVNYVFWTCTPSPTCRFVDGILYRVVIDVRQ